jgi:1-acyl-sn-glycerol-3-phosphate acyltransferase
MGWKEKGTFPEGDKYVVVAAPHTSTWDFIIGRLYYFSIGKHVKFMIKGTYFFFPLGIILRALGGIPVFLNSKTPLAQQIINEFDKHDKFLLTIAPEGTRSKVNRWRKGFYYMAKGAKVPIVLGYIDFGNKTVGNEGIYYPTDDMDFDFKEIQKFYRDKKARHPEKFYLAEDL